MKNKCDRRKFLGIQIPKIFGMGKIFCV